MADIVLSYASEDRSRVQPFVEVLESQGWSVWWDRAIASGSRWDDVIQRELDAARAVVVVWTRRSVASDWVRTEAMEGLERGMLFPVSLDSADVPLAFKRTQAAMLEDWSPGEPRAEYDRFVAALHEFLRSRPVTPEVALSAPTQQRVRRRWMWAVTAIAVAAVVLGWLVIGERGRVAPPPTGPSSEVAVTPIRSVIELHPEAPLAVGGSPPLIGFYSTAIALSPDGQHLAYVGERPDGLQLLYLRELSRYGFRPVEGSQGAIFPFFSPDGESLGFLTNDKVKTVSVSGGTPVAVANANTPVMAEWLADGHIYVTEQQGSLLFKTPAGGGRRIPVVDFANVGLDSWFTDLRSPLIQTLRGRDSMSTDHARIIALDQETRAQKLLVPSGYGGRHTLSGHLVFARGGDLFAAPYVPSDGTVGSIRQAVSNVLMESLFGIVQVAWSDTGLLAYATGGDSAVSRLAWVHRDGSVHPVPISPRGLQRIRPVAGRRPSRDSRSRGP